MKKQLLCVAGVLALSVSGSARASLVSVDIIPGPANPGAFDTWRVVARFSDPGDQISAVNGVAGANPIHFFTGGGDMYNQGIFAGLTLNDFPGVGIGGEAWDSYVTIGATVFDANVRFTPGFLGGTVPPPTQVIVGSTFWEDDGAWFFFGAPPEVSDLEDDEAGNETFDIVVFQVGVNTGVGFSLMGNIQWFNPVSGDNNTPFHVENLIPVPGALALLGLAGLVGKCRRRE